MKNIQFETNENDPFKPSCFTITLVPLLAVAPVVITFVWLFHAYVPSHVICLAILIFAKSLLHITKHTNPGSNRLFVHSMPAGFEGLPTQQPDWNSNAQTWQMFNWHPALMMLFLTFGGLAIFAFKALPMGHLAKKIIHALLHSLAVIASILGFAFMVWWKNKSGNEQFWSLHSWIGIAILGIYWLQYLAGFVFFLFPGPQAIAKRIRAQVVLGHRHAGLMIFVIVAVAVLTGFMSRQWLIMFDSPIGGQVRNFAYTGSNLVGLLTSVIVIFALFVFRHIKPQEDEHHYSPIRDIEYR